MHYLDHNINLFHHDDHYNQEQKVVVVAHNQMYLMVVGDMIHYHWMVVLDNNHYHFQDYYNQDVEGIDMLIGMNYHDNQFVEGCDMD